MKNLVSAGRSMLSGIPPGAAFLIASAILFLGGARGFARAGAHQMSQLGLLGAAAAIAIAVAFCNWRRPTRQGG